MFHYTLTRSSPGFAGSQCSTGMDPGAAHSWHLSSEHLGLPVHLVCSAVFCKFQHVAGCNYVYRTNKKFKSTIHRVTNLTGQERYTIPFFFGVDYDTTVAVLPSCITEDSPACKKPFKAGEVRRIACFTFFLLKEQANLVRHSGCATN